MMMLMGDAIVELLRQHNFFIALQIIWYQVWGSSAHETEPLLASS